jgi:hypothetical protein
MLGVACSSIAGHVLGAIVQDTGLIDTILVCSTRIRLTCPVEVTADGVHAVRKRCKGDILLFVRTTLADLVDARDVRWAGIVVRAE